MRICLLFFTLLASTLLQGQALYNLDDLEFWPKHFAFVGDRMLIGGNSCEGLSGPGGPEGYLERGHLMFVDDQGDRETPTPLSSSIQYLQAENNGLFNVCSLSHVGQYCQDWYTYTAQFQIRNTNAALVTGESWYILENDYYPYINTIRHTPNDGMLLMATSAQKVFYYTAPGDSVWSIDLNLPADPNTEMWPSGRLNGIGMDQQFIVNSWYHTPILRAYDYAGNPIWEQEQLDWGFMIYDLHTSAQGRIYFTAKSLVDGALVEPIIVGELNAEGELLWTQEVTELLSPGVPMLALYPNGDLAVCASKTYAEDFEPIAIARFSADGAPLSTLTFASSYTNFFGEFKLHADHPKAIGVDSAGRVWVLNRSQPEDNTLPIRFQVVLFDEQGHAPHPFPGFGPENGAELVGVYNLLGQEVDHVKPNMLLLYRYSDGSVVKMVVEPD